MNRTVEPQPYGVSRLKYWLASFWTNAWPNIDAKSVPASSSPM
ncbi:MAG: hypothetical protein ACRDLY_00120 [Thermoleophilaceae bacterium]